MDALAIVQQVYALAGAGEWDAAEKLLSDDLVIEEAASLPYAGTWRGKRALRELYAVVMGHWADPHIELHAMTAGDDHVVALVTFHMTSKATGRRLAAPLAEVWRVADGTVVAITPYYFDAGAVSALDRLNSSPRGE